MKKLLIILLALFFPFTALASTQVISGSVNAPGTTGTKYNYYFSGQAGAVPGATADNTIISTVMPVAGTFSNLRANYDYVPGGSNSVAITIRKNSVDQTLTCTITSAVTTCSDLSNSFAVVQGDKITMKIVYSASAPLYRLSYTLDFTPTTANDTFITIRPGASMSTTLESYSLMTNNGFLTQPEIIGITSLFPEAGTIDMLTASTTAPGAGKTYAIGLRTNLNATSTVTCTVDGNAPNWCTDNVNTLSVSAGDMVDFYTLPSGTPAVSGVATAVRFVPTTLGNFNFLHKMSSGTDSGTLNSYHALYDGFAVATQKEASTTVVVNSMTMTGISVKIVSAPGASKSRTFYLRQNYATTTLSCTISGAAATTCTGTDTISIADGDLLDVVDAPSGTPANSNGVHIGLIGNRSGAAATPVTSAKHKFTGGFFRLVGGMFRFK